MDGLISRLPELPHVVWTLILIPIFISLGALVGLVVQRRVGGRWALPVAMMLGFAIATASSNLVADAQARDREAKTLVGELAGEEPLTTILRLDPAARGVLEKRFAAVFRTTRGIERGPAARRVLAEFVGSKVAESLETAGASELHRNFRAELAMLRALAGRPETCVDFYLGKGLPSFEGVDRKVLAELMASRAGLIESAALRPQRLAEPVSGERFGELLKKGAAVSGQDFAVLADLTRIVDLPAERACHVAIVYETVVSALEPAELADLSKSAALMAKPR